MSAPPTLPQSTNTAAAGAASQPPIATPAFRSFISRLSSSLRQGFSQRRPWTELADRSSFSKPESLTEAYSRIRKNFNYFRVNYVTLIVFALAVSLITHPFSLLVLLGLLASWCFLYLFRPADQPVILYGRTFNVFLTSVGSLLISASMVGLAIVCAHGAFRMPEDLFLDEQEPGSTGLLSFLGGAATSAAAPVVSRV
ncbi:hypothetical protein Ahy_B07g088087 isoform B [Arachis hypogaea]|uniref:PRA1 family protein n=1 Tax=Arachis hypogaea TaxID=3818 RepID=A0A444YDN5_ARAHY|nr:hypothetical protein Ahy_B07g088087 isoform B [Arachis hypogaea]